MSSIKAEVEKILCELAAMSEEEVDRLLEKHANGPVAQAIKEMVDQNEIEYANGYNRAIADVLRVVERAIENNVEFSPDVVCEWITDALHYVEKDIKQLGVKP